MGDGWEGGQRRPPRRWPAVLSAAVIVLVVAALVSPSAGGGGRLDIVPAEPALPTPSAEANARPSPVHRPRTPRPSPSPLPELVGAWSRMPPLPVAPRSGTVAVWTGHELIVWGGEAFDEVAQRAVFFADGAAFDPEAGTWRALRSAPLAARTAAAGSWNGSELVVWGGGGPTSLFADGAAYDPATDRWRPLPPAPLSPRRDAVAVDAGGGRVLVLGGADHAGALADGAVLDPGVGSWEPVESPTRGWWTMASPVPGGAIIGSGGQILRFDRASGALVALPWQPQSEASAFVEVPGGLVGAAADYGRGGWHLERLTDRGWTRERLVDAPLTGPGSAVAAARGFYLLEQRARGLEVRYADAVDAGVAQLAEVDVVLGDGWRALVADHRLVVLAGVVHRDPLPVRAAGVLWTPTA